MLIFTKSSNAIFTKKLVYTSQDGKYLLTLALRSRSTLAAANTGIKCAWSYFATRCSGVSPCWGKEKKAVTF